MDAAENNSLYSGRSFMGNVTVWTRQVPEMLDELEQTGIYRVREDYIRKKNDTIADYYL